MTTQYNEAVKLLIESSQKFAETVARHTELPLYHSQGVFRAITAVREALAQPDVPEANFGNMEPVASLMTHVQSGDMEVVWNDDGFDRELWHETPLYTAPPQRKPLSEEEIGSICAPLGFAQLSPVEVARAIERAHGIGGSDE